MRLESTKVAMWFLPPSVVGYAWVCEKDVHVSAVCVMLFLAGFFSMFVPFKTSLNYCLVLTYVRATIRWIYASTLAYIVDANVGRSSTATASNSAIRGISAFVAAEIAVPLQVRLYIIGVNCPDCISSRMLSVMAAYIQFGLA
jgi:hypothetical protein